MSLGTLVIGINGQTQLLIDLTVLVAFALVIFVICLHAGILVRPDDAAATLSERPGSPAVLVGQHRHDQAYWRDCR